MEPKVAKFEKYLLTYFNKAELNILLDEIFNKKIYDIDLETTTPIIFDVGAHIGLATIFFNQKYPLARITAFEPNPNTFPLLEENTYFNNIHNVTLHNVALGKKSSQRTLFIDSSNNGGFSTASFMKDAWNGTQESLGIEVITEPLSKYINSTIDLVKIDVEGTEQEIIEELDESGKIGSIKNIIIEFHPTEKQDIEKIKSILQKNGFTIEIRKDKKDKLVYILGKHSL
ncbi:MAG TPA: FkbM family methyltransferase [Candidatus Dojkabacteria bacterium]|nr:FkbM family methyltransferase [Candidatus Dojkabacteria bacterium]HOR06221.1 FkbM family methyltransferase [Candidatus Dojkabacteria bacterium]HQI92681.1 FkbM family methyltransferase [Candidatus Dojkabacteria bacterium]